MRKRSIFDRLPLYLLWALFAALVTMGIFQAVTDTDRAHKLTVMVNVKAEELQDTALMRKLSEELPEGIRMIQVRPFSYAMFREKSLKDADMWIIRESDFEKFLPDLGPVEGFRADHPDLEYYTVQDGDREIWGVKIYDAASRTGALKEYIGYGTADAPEEDHYIVFNPASVHIGREGRDTLAFRLAERLLQIP